MSFSYSEEFAYGVLVAREFVDTLVFAGHYLFSALMSDEEKIRDAGALEEIAYRERENLE